MAESPPEYTFEITVKTNRRSCPRKNINRQDENKTSKISNYSWRINANEFRLYKLGNTNNETAQ